MLTTKVEFAVLAVCRLITEIPVSVIACAAEQKRGNFEILKEVTTIYAIV